MYETGGNIRAPDIRQELSLLCRRLCSLRHQPEVGVGPVLECHNRRLCPVNYSAYLAGEIGHIGAPTIL